MSAIQSTQKTLEVKIRPYTNPKIHDRADQKGASRVHLSREALHELRLDSGQRCYLWKVGEDESARKEAIVWLTPENSLSKKVIQISKAFQDASHFKLGDDLFICAVGNLDEAETIVLKEITIPVVVQSREGREELPTSSELASEKLPYWSFFLEDYLCMCQLTDY